MSSLSSIYIKKETLLTLLETLNAKKDAGVSLTISINEDTNQFGQNLSCWVEQSKEERDVKKNRFYVGNGKCFWTDGAIKIADQKAEQKEVSNKPVESDLPF